MQAKVHSVDTIADLEQAITSFALASGERLAAMRLEFARRLALLEDKETDAKRVVARWRDTAELSEDLDEIESALAQLEQARERLGRLRSWQMQVREDHALFATAASQFDLLLNQIVPRCQQHLRKQYAELRAYEAVQLADDMADTPAAVVVVAAEVGIQAPSSEPGEGAGGPSRVTDFSLPPGFVWVPLSEVSKARLAEVSSLDSYKKVSYDEMVEGFRQLANEVLSRVHADPKGVDRYTFQVLDDAEGRSYEDGLQRVYEAFFGGDGFIYLDRRRGADLFEITNGRHRIRVALDLGWEAVPARVKDLNR